ncbi:hypothetical protein TWF730_007395 [Orbilia blumenaviensis]|uniref:H-type lectin domain-containing protein n=1 Tax=Orbilia blumenaviensis TaxID=1796055 RepID=A0AAV9VAX6_9PEZI
METKKHDPESTTNKDWATKYANFSSPGPSATQRTLRHDDYTVGLFVTLDTELEALKLLLDEGHEQLSSDEKDSNNYVLGRMGVHNVVIVSPGLYAEAGDSSIAAQMVENLARAFKSVRFGLLVGVGGGAPTSPNLEDPSKDIRLGDVVVADSNCMNCLQGGVLQYDVARWRADGEFSITSRSKQLPAILSKGVRLLRSDHSFGRGEMNQYIQDGIAVAEALKPSHSRDFNFPGQDRDRLYKSNYWHVGGNDCSGCNKKVVERRLQRDSNDPEVHYGLIASSDIPMKSTEHRDKLRNGWGVSCFETGAAGLKEDFPCVVVRGISHYSDDHKNERWESYAAIVAAAYAKDLLRIIKWSEVAALPSLLTPARTTLPDPTATGTRVPITSPSAGPSGSGATTGLGNRVAQLETPPQKFAENPIPRKQKEADAGTWETPLKPSDEAQQRIEFLKPFSSLPTVVVGISAADGDASTNFRFRVLATDIDLKGFTLRVKTWGDAMLHNCAVSWSAQGDEISI